MRQLSTTLLAAQKQAAAVPGVKVVAANKIAGVVRYDWGRLYTGAEDDYFHALAMPGDGSLIRARVTPPADSRKLYRQRVANPGPGSDFSQWTYTGQYNAVVVAAASLGAEVSIFWTNSSREIRRIKSTDYGASWFSPELTTIRRPPPSTVWRPLIKPLATWLFSSPTRRRSTLKRTWAASGRPRWPGTRLPVIYPV
jgi:hypothetical protein